MSSLLLIRYGTMGEVARFQSDAPLDVGDIVVAQSSRGEELGTVVGRVANSSESASSEMAEAASVLRIASDEDHAAAERCRATCEAEFGPWQERIRDWDVAVELIDIERTLDGKLILYCLNDRGPETTKLALRAAAAGFGVIEVQPVGPEGLIHDTGGGSCGRCGR